MVLGFSNELLLVNIYNIYSTLTPLSLVEPCNSLPVSERTGLFLNIGFSFRSIG